MRKPRLEKVTVNIGVNAVEKVEIAMKLIEKLAGQKPVQTYSKHKIPDWNLREGLPIGAKVTLRGKKADEFLRRALVAVDNVLKINNFDNAGNVSFGVEQYIFFEGVKYDPSIGTRGLQVVATLDRPGFRIKRRKIRSKSISKKHAIFQGEAIAFLKSKYGIKVENE